MFNLVDHVADRIISELEKGTVPWHKPWTCDSVAYNIVSKKPYSILNQMLLDKPGAYATYKQWTELGGHVKKNEKSHLVVFWKMQIIEINSDNNENEDEDEKIEKQIPLLRYYNVFHFSQVEGIEDIVKEKIYDHNVDVQADALFYDYIKREHIKFEMAGDGQAYYSPMKDMIHVPDLKYFRERAEYYSTIFHEAVHSTGASNRLGRLNKKNNMRFGSENYSQEELVAEIGAASILSYLGIETNDSFENSAAYIKSWLSALRNDKKMIVYASSQAEKAINLILS